MDFEKLILEIIPPSDYSHRNGFSNIHILDKLSLNEKQTVEDLLINKLIIQSLDRPDHLIIETLGYLKSIKSISILKKLLDKSSNLMDRILLASTIYEINGDPSMSDIAIDSFNSFDKKNAYYIYDITQAFYY